MTLLLLLFLTISTHNLSAAASSISTTIDQIAKNKQSLMEYIKPISTLLKWRSKHLATTTASSVTHVFSEYTKDMTKLNKQISNEADGHSAILSAAFIDELLHHATNRTISKQDLRREVARSMLCLAERINWNGTDISKDVSITETEPLSRHAIYFKRQLRRSKTSIITHLLYAVCFPQSSLTHSCVFDCLDALGFMPKIDPLVVTDATTDDTPTDEPLHCEPHQLVAKDFYDLAIEELTFIKSHLSYLAPTQADETADPAYYHALLTQFHVKQKEFREEPAEEKESLCFDDQLAKVLLLLDHHYARYVDDNVNVANYADIIRWRFNLFTKIETTQHHLA
jgi:hypothetical protein